VASDECGSLVMMNSESVEKDLNDIKWWNRHSTQKLKPSNFVKYVNMKRL
jgi:hypothetical protein